MSTSAERAAIDRQLPGARFWIGAAVLALVVGALVIRHWSGMAAESRERFEAAIERIQSGDRAALVAEWGETVTWHPDIEARPALAILPRHPRQEFDAIFVAYDEPQQPAVVSFTTLGGYVNGARLDRAEYPETWLDRALTPSERRGLRLLERLLAERLERIEREHPLDTQSERYSWNRHVLETLRAVRERQPGTQ